MAVGKVLFRVFSHFQSYIFKAEYDLEKGGRHFEFEKLILLANLECSKGFSFNIIDIQLKRIYMHYVLDWH